FGPWLAGIGLNLARRRLRERSKDAWSWDALLGGRLEPRALVGPWGADPDPAEVAEEAELASRIRQAVRGLPPGQRAAVVLFYLAGMTTREVSGVLGIKVVAVKARLHKGRAALRERLWELWKEEVMGIDEETGITRMRVADVRRGPGEGTGIQQHVVFLEEVGGERRLPIWIGSFEATALAMALEHTQLPRPGAYQFMTQLLRAAGSRLKEVRISRLSEGTFYAEALIESQEGAHVVDARPSDVLNLALIEGSPIFVVDSVLEAMEKEAVRPLSPAGTKAAFPDGPSQIVAETQAKQAEALKALRHRPQAQEP
ncbi:MAG: bifunctional nuclease domain-containing protein, partial [Actinomycetota bacterium]